MNYNWKKVGQTAVGSLIGVSIIAIVIALSSFFGFLSKEMCGCVLCDCQFIISLCLSVGIPIVIFTFLSGFLTLKVKAKEEGVEIDVKLDSK